MTLTHPDILCAERTGYPCGYYPKAKKIGICLYCGEDITNAGEYVKSFDGVFCDMDCYHNYYEIKTVDDI